MPQPKHLDPSPFKADGGPLGVLLIHGFTGAAAETRPLGEYLAARGLTVCCPLLPGHGTTPLDLTRVSWRDWSREATAALDDLLARCRLVFAGGLSLGSLLTLWLGSQRPEIAGLIVYAPAIKVLDRRMPLTLALRYVMKYAPPAAAPGPDQVDPEAANRTWCYDQTPLWGAGEVYLLQRRVRKLLPQIRQPMLIFQGRRDAALDPAAGQILYDRAGSSDKELIWLANSGHNVLVDTEREAIWARSYEWIMAHCQPA